MCEEWVGILRWAVELGRLDIYLEVSLILSYVANPRRGHSKEILHIFGYLKRRNKLAISFDPRHPSIDEERFIECSGRYTEQFTKATRKRGFNNMLRLCIPCK